MSDKNSQLLELFNKRISLTSEQADLDTVWYQCFPTNVGNTSSFEHFISCTLYRPRDIVEFIMLAKNRYPTKSKLSITEFKDLVKTYSIEHFYPEMLNELSGFLDEEIISNLDNLFKRTLTGRDGTFKYAWFEENFNNLHGDTSESSKDVIEILFLRGYIGLSRHIKGKNRINFIHKDPRLSLNVDGSLVLHKGLYAAVNVLSY